MATRHTIDRLSERIDALEARAGLAQRRVFIVFGRNDEDEAEQIEAHRRERGYREGKDDLIRVRWVASDGNGGPAKDAEL